MKILFLNLLMSLTTPTSDMYTVEDYDWVLQELNSESAMTMVASEIEAKVKVFDAAGNLVKEILKKDFNENNMETSEYKVLSASAFMFEYLGDSYFLLEE